MASTRSIVNLQDSLAIGQITASESWDAFINAVAYTDADRVETEERLAFAVNVEAFGRNAADTAIRIPLIDISTDYLPIRGLIAQ